MRLSGRAIMSFCIMLVGAGVCINALAWPFKAALFPMIVGVPVFGLAMIDFLYAAFEKEGKKASGIDFTFSEDVDKTLERKRTASIFLWTLGFFFFVLLVGFPIAVPLFVLAYLKLQGKEGWGVTIATMVITWGAFYGLFVWFLNVPFMEGWIQQGFRALNIL
jgi:hypothetical protein